MPPRVSWKSLREAEVVDRETLQTLPDEGETPWLAGETVEYDCKKDAANAIGTNTTTLRHWLNGTDIPTKLIWQGIKVKCLGRKYPQEVI